MVAGGCVAGTASADPPRFRVVDLGVLDDQVDYIEVGEITTSAQAINNWGQVVGNTQACDEDPIWCDNPGAFESVDFLWLPASSTYSAFFAGMNRLPAGAGQGANLINDHGHVIAGVSRYYWNLNDLGESGALSYPEITSINNEVPPRLVGNVGQGLARYAWRHTLGEPLPIELLFPDTPQQDCHAWAINDFGMAVGDGFRPVNCPNGDDCLRGHFWPLSTSGGTAMAYADISLPHMSAFDVNSQGHAVGIAQDEWSGQPDVVRAAFWEEAIATPEHLPFLPGIADSMEAYAIANEMPNGEIWVVGRSVLANSAVLWIRDATETWEAHDLLDLLECGSSSVGAFLPHFANDRQWIDINNAGWIVVQGEDSESRKTSFVLIPMDGCSGDINRDGQVSVGDLLELLSAWGTADVSGCHSADLDGNGTVGVGDMLILLSSWGACPGYPQNGEPDSMSQVLASAGLTSADFDDYLAVMAGQDAKAKANWNCWMQNYIMQCQVCPECPGRDPFVEE